MLLEKGQLVLQAGNKTNRLSDVDIRKKPCCQEKQL
jgi:hypothetical protein